MAQIRRENRDQDGFFWVKTLTVNGRPVRAPLPSAVLQGADASGPPSISAQDDVEGAWGEWTLTATPLTKLFVGAGEVDYARLPVSDPRSEAGEMYLRFARRDGNLVIPGTSLKGAVRSLAELLSPSCLLLADERELHQTGVGMLAACKPKQEGVCPACGMFGALGWRGRVCFEDAFIANPYPQMHGIDQRTQATSDKPAGEAAPTFRKLYARDQHPQQATQSDQTEWLEVLETLPADREAQSTTSFPVRVRFQQLASWEVGLLLLALGVAPDMTIGNSPVVQRSFDFKMGGAKNRGFGVVRLEWQGGTIGKGAPGWLNGLRPMTATFRKQYLEIFQRKAQKWGLWGDIEEIIAWLREEYIR